ncbi:CaiB/BaiF CoA transferase family protein [Mycolicibacterium moriokaense]|uniref:Crotonobetainyl-CoA:carnitine CoA-transferase CaiB-like acyl-CoA transferase n=1 Tax=Mycolicibacterium moriokaense TaxID=39691 RepID=A0A318H925_9MYCO|nr:CoA transferase [Mycolicibacterium moriokaense]PXX01660.1 crotonobetainyl-CoA:carnitine CoA-transferase CaiB-like acyl-CoA transferase [Mycolicibacterium moriokaense]
MTSELCAGLVVAEIGSGSAPASLAGMLFADAGARVLKIEPPSGDRMRREHPSGFLVWNRGKESITVDLHEPEGQAAAWDLAGRVDVVIEGFATGVAAKFGLDEARLRAANPALVYCSIKGFPSSSRYGAIKGYEAVVTAKTGWMNPGTGGKHGYREGPIFSNVLTASVGCGNFAFSGSLAALLARRITGRGQFLEATMAQGLTPADYYGVHAWQWERGMLAYGPDRPRPDTGEKTSETSGSRVYPFSRSAPMLCSKDGRWVNTTQLLQPQAQALLRALQLDEMLTDHRFEAAPYFDSGEDAEEYVRRLAERFRERTIDEWMPRVLAEDSIAFEPQVFSEEALDHPQARHNGHVVTVRDDVVGPVEQVGPMGTYSATPITIGKSAPLLGGHDSLPARLSATRPSGSVAHPLSGITVVECGFFYAMPFGVALLAALGARVIKVEPLTGDPIRNAFGIWEGGGTRTMEGKESICLDLTDPAGQAVLHRLVETADVFITSYRPGADARLGVDHQTLASLNPRLVYVQAPGYGQTGPYSRRAMFAGTASALAGSVGRHAGAWLSAEASEGLSAFELAVIVAPRLFAPTDGDSNQSLSIMSNLVAALWHQANTGRGQLIEATMMNGNLWAYADDAVRYAGKPQLRVSDAEFHGIGALYRLYEAASGSVFIAVTTDREWAALSAAIDVAELRSERFATAADRSGNDDELTSLLGGVFTRRPASEWEAMLVPAGIACVEVFEKSASEFTNTDAEMRRAGLVSEVDHALFGRMTSHGPPVRFSDAPARVAPAAAMGQHTRHILATAGYTPEQIAELEAKAVVAQSSLVYRTREDEG